MVPKTPRGSQKAWHCSETYTWAVAGAECNTVIELKQMTFADAEYAGKRKQTRKELFLIEMDQVVALEGLGYADRAGTISATFLICAS